MSATQILRSLSFSWYDYILFCGMLSICTVIGIYFGCFGSKQSTKHEYLLGSKKMSALPVAISLVASHISGIALLAIPADIYRYGATFWWSVCTSMIVALCTIYIFLPVFYKLEITSTYEYLEKRFDNKIRMFASFLFGIGAILYLPIVIYIPALAFTAATGVNVHYITPVVCSICIFYTTLGGLKAVIWTDTLQFTITIGAVVVVLFIGINEAGGFGPIWNAAVEGDRLDIFDFDFDPTKRESFWIIMIGMTFSWLSNTGVHQSCVQKYLALPTLKEAKRSVLYFTIGVATMHTFCVWFGLIMYARYADCDPFAVGIISKNDQLLPFYIIDVASNVPGLPGLFIAGIFCAALSTLSANLNSLAGTFYEDFILKVSGIPKNEKTAGYILRFVVVLFGVICTGLVFVIEKLGGVFPLVLSLTSITGGPLVGMFCLGVLFPKASSRGTLYGSMIGLVFVGSICFTAQYYKAIGVLPDIPKVTSIDGCSNSSTIYSIVPSTNHSESTDFNNKLFNESMDHFARTNEEVFYLFKISFWYYTPLGTFITIICGLLLSYLLPNNDPKVVKGLLSPVIYPLLSKKLLKDEIVIHSIPSKPQ